MQNNNIWNLIYSSTASVYGMPETLTVDETAPLRPINPYGRSKVMVENILHDLSAATAFPFRSFALLQTLPAPIRNAASAQAYRESTHLITRALKTAHGEFPKTLHLLATDYPTADGTCIRDYYTCR